MVLGAFWRYLGLLLGPLGGLLGDLWKLLGVSWATLGSFKNVDNVDKSWLGAWLLLLFLHLLVECSSKLLLILSWGFLGSILDPQDEPPNLKIFDFSSNIHCFLKYRLFIFQDGIETVLELSWAPFWRSWGSLGRPLGAPYRPKRGDTH